ncbi:RNA polymerase sigma factor [Propionibacteriaceae bacterium Y1685]|uniref:RNA polymerase sigma factor n=1 Tax=Microlunatus sp. Y1700 TaxID=3418487 RepID=UPI003B80A1D4
MDESTFDAFYETSFDRIVGQIHAMCGNVAEAQDCVQEAFVRAWDKRRSLDQQESPEAWVRTVAYRLAVSRWRRTRHKDKLTDPTIQPAQPAQPDITRVALARALQELPADQRRAIVLFHLCDLPLTEVAKEVRAPIGTVKARITRGRRALAILLADQLPDDGSGADHARAASPAAHVTTPKGSSHAR